MMRKSVVFILCVISCGVALAQESDQGRQLAKANEVLREIMQTPDKGIPGSLLDKAVCVGIVPAEIKFAFGVGASYGRGVLVCRRHGDGPWGAPSLFTMGGGSFGFQIGGKATDIVFIVMNPGGARKLLQSKVTLGADASVAGGPVGRTASAETDAQMTAEILSYSRSRGLFGGVALNGAVLKQDNGSNAKLYGRRVSARNILFRDEVTIPPEGQRLDRTLARYSPHGGARVTAQLSRQ
jgi:SH3 domain-containing YSC84-like protein 1